MLKASFRISMMMTLAILIGMIACLGLGQLEPAPNTLELANALVCDLKPCIHPPDSNHIQTVTSIVNTLTQQQSGLMHYDRYSVRYWRSIDQSQTYIQIEDTTTQGLMLLGDIIAHKGIPCSITLTEDAVNVQYPDFYASTNIAEALSTPHGFRKLLSPFMPIETISFLPTTTGCKSPLTFTTYYNIITEWHGFRNLAFYTSHRIR